MKKLFFIMLLAVLIISCNNNKNQSLDDIGPNATSHEEKAERNKQIVLKRMKAMGSGKADSVIREESTDKDFIDYRDGSVPPKKGINVARVDLQQWMNAFPDYEGKNFLAVADGDYVMVYAEWTGTWKNNFKGMKATGKSFKMNEVDIFKLNDAGKVIEHREVQSIATIAKQVDMPIPIIHP